MTNTYTKETLKIEDLSQFCGTTQYWKASPFHSFVYTDGVEHVAEHGGAYWILDLISSYQPESVLRNDEMLQQIQIWTLTVNEDQSAVMRCDHDEGHTVISQILKSTDFPLPEIRFYLQNIWCYWNYKPEQGPRTTQNYGVLFLPSEY